MLKRHKLDLDYAVVSTKMAHVPKINLLEPVNRIETDFASHIGLAPASRQRDHETRVPQRRTGGGDGGPIGRPKRLGRAAGAGVTTRRRRRASRRAHLSPRAALLLMTPAPARAWTQPAPHARGHRHEHADVRRRALLCERVGLAPARRESWHVGEAFTSRGRTQRRVASRSSMATTTTTQRWLISAAAWHAADNRRRTRGAASAAAQVPSRGPALANGLQLGEWAAGGARDEARACRRGLGKRDWPAGGHWIPPLHVDAAQKWLSFLHGTLGGHTLCYVLMAYGLWDDAASDSVSVRLGHYTHHSRNKDCGPALTSCGLSFGKFSWHCRLFIAPMQACIMAINA